MLLSAACVLLCVCWCADCRSDVCVLFLFLSSLALLVRLLVWFSLFVSWWFGDCLSDVGLLFLFPFSGAFGSIIVLGRVLSLFLSCLFASWLDVVFCALGFLIDSSYVSQNLNLHVSFCHGY